MKVLRQTEAELTLQEQPWLIWVVGGLFIVSGGYVALASDEVAFGGGFLGAGLLIVLFFARTVRCSFDRAAGQFTLETRGLLGAKQTRRPLQDIVGARAGRSTSSKGTSYRVELVLSSGEDLPLTSTFGSGKQDKDETVALICKFLNMAAPVEVPILGFRDLLDLMLNPEGADAHRHQALALALQNRPDEARATLEQAKQLLLRAGNHGGAGELDTMLEQLDNAAAHGSNLTAPPPH